MKIRRALVKVTVPFAFACMTVGACVSAAPYNPGRLGSDQLARVGGICQNVIGLSPTEPLVWGIHTGVADLDTWTSHYRGCVFSLSSSLSRLDSQRVARQAEEACRAKGLAPDSAELAVCVLRARSSEPSAGTAEPATLAAASGEAPTHPLRSFYSASHREIGRREQLACAELGLVAASAPFESCVRNLKRTFFAIDNPVN